MQVIKRDKSKEWFSIDKIICAVDKAFKSCGIEMPNRVRNYIPKLFPECDIIGVEEVQDRVEQYLMLKEQYYQVAKAFIIYRERHKDTRLIKDKINYIINYSKSTENAASNSNTDANANNSIKNVASIEPEVFKDKNRLIQRQLLKNKLNELYPEVAKQYEIDLNNHIIYCHDESSSPIPKAYCGAYTLYPLMNEGVGNIDNITPTPPNDIQSFSGQVTNLVFALSAQTKGAVALSDYLVTFNYYINQEYGEEWYTKYKVVISNEHCLNKVTIEKEIKKGMKQFIYGINQPQGNRGYQSPFTNCSIFDYYYFNSLFGDYYYPDGTKPKWEAVDILQRIFISLLRELRLLKPLTFPVTTFALLYDNNGYRDQNYANLCAEEWAKGSSHFLYQSSNADSLSSCCRVQNKLTDNYFSSTTGMVGVMTGSCNVITLNINRIVQDAVKLFEKTLDTTSVREGFLPYLKNYLSDILERVYKYHIAYKTMLYELEEQGMITYSTANYLYMMKLYSTIGVIGYYEAAKFLNLEDNSEEYQDFMVFIMETINNLNAEHSIYDKKKPFIFNLEAIPGENLAVKFYNWDRNAGYKVPEDQNLYNCYFFNPWKEDNILNKIKAHGSRISKASSGGQGCHLNLQEHLSKEQYLKVMDFARTEGCNYFTFNIPMSECEECHHVVNAPITECPLCNSKNISYYTRIIGFLTKVNNWSNERQQEFTKRYFGKC